LIEADISKKHALSNFSPKDGDSTLLCHVGFYQPTHTKTKPKRTSSVSGLVLCRIAALLVTEENYVMA
jgi:hypothetical protein